jgi:hypothetical protein
VKNKPIYKDIYLLFPFGSFPGGEWAGFITTLGRDSRKHCITDDHVIWNSIPGKGFLVWISEPHPWSHDGASKWRIIVSLASNNVRGIVLQHLIPYLAIEKWQQFEIFMPETCALFRTTSEFLIFAKQAIINQVSREELLKYGYLDEHGEIQLTMF